MLKKFLFSSVLTAAVAVSAIATAEDAPQAKQPVKSAKATHKKVAHHSKKKHHDDAYSPSAHKKDGLREEVLLLASSQRQGAIVEAPRDKLVNHDGLSVKVGGQVNVQYGIVDQQKDFKNPANNENLPQSENVKPATMPTFGGNGSKYTNQNAMISSGELTFTAEKDHDGNKYGLELNTNASASASSSGNTDIANKAFLFMENKMGRFEVGAVDGPSESMGISAGTIAKGTGGIDGDYSNWVPYGSVGGAGNVMLEDTFLTSPNLPYASQHSKKANKLNYYSPTVNGFKLGLGYVRDVTVKGTTFEALSFKGSGYENVFEAGASYEHKVNDMSFALSATGQVGEARPAYVEPTGQGTTAQTIDLKRLGAWEVGGKVAFNKFAVAASYGDWGKSGTLKTPAANAPKPLARFWTAGASYDHSDKAGFSLTYMSSERRGAFSMNALNYTTANSENFAKAKQKFEALSVGGEYKVLPGLVPYTEVTHFKYKTTLADAKGNKGTVFLGGVKLNF